MTTCLQYGPSKVIRFEIPAESIVLDRPGPEGEVLDDPAAAVAAGLANPIEFPPLEQAVTGDDQVAIALGPGVPCAEAIVAGVVYALTEAGLAASQITIVQDACEAALHGRDVAAGLPLEYRDQVKLVSHDPTNREQLTYLAANQEGDPIYFQRAIGDADLVIPIACLRGDQVLGDHGMQSQLYPVFADESAQQRFRTVDAFRNSPQRKQRIDQAEEANWLLGVMLYIGVLPGDRGGVLDLLVGERSAVTNLARGLCENAWAFETPQPSDLVVASISGDSEQQTWENVGRALEAAAQLISEQGAIVICSDLDTPPAQSMQRLAGEETGGEALRAINKDSFADTLAADRLASLCERHSIYFRSKLEADVVESLGMAFVSSDEEIVRLSSRFRSCSLIGSAQFAMPRPLSPPD